MTRCFNTQPPEGGWSYKISYDDMGFVVSTHSRLKAAGASYMHDFARYMVSTHSRLKAAGLSNSDVPSKLIVSTHSRLKAAGQPECNCLYQRTCFNTQPPEGGWLVGLQMV